MEKGGFDGIGLDGMGWRRDGIELDGGGRRGGLMDMDGKEGV